MPKSKMHKQPTKASMLEAAQKTASEMADAEAFGREVRSEHEALGKLLVMLDHITGMPTVPGVVDEARRAFTQVRIRTMQISSAAGTVISGARWPAQ